MKKVILTILVAMISLPLVFAGGANESSDEIVLNWPSFWVGADTKAGTITELVNEFNAMYEGKYQVNIQENPDTDGYRDKLNAQIGVGQVPDLFILDGGATAMQFCESDLLMDFTEELQGEWGETFAPGTLDAVTINGKIRTIPYEMQNIPIWYNTNILKEAGIENTPQTKEEFFEFCDKVKAAGYVPTSQMTGGTNAFTSQLFYSYICATLGGPNVWDDYEFGSDPLFVEAAEILNYMYQDGNTTNDAIGAGPEISGGHYMAGHTAAFSNGPWYIARVQQEAPEVFEATQLDYFYTENYDNIMLSGLLSGLSAANTDDPARREAVITFMKWMTAPANIKRVSEAAGSTLAVVADIDTSKNRLQAQVYDLINNADYICEPFALHFEADVVAEFGQALAAMAQGAISEEEFVAQVAAVID